MKLRSTLFALVICLLAVVSAQAQSTSTVSGTLNPSEVLTIKSVVVRGVSQAGYPTTTTADATTGAVSFVVPINCTVTLSAPTTKPLSIADQIVVVGSETTYTLKALLGKSRPDAGIWVANEGTYFSKHTDYINIVGPNVKVDEPFNGILKVHIGAVVALTDAATVATDASLGCHFRVTFAGNRTLSNPTNGENGQRITWEIIQDGTGSRLLTLGNKFAFGSDITDATLTTAASKRDFLTAQYNSTADKWYVVDFKKGY